MNALNGQEHVVKKSKFTEEQIAFALKQAELGTRVEEVCRKMGISEATFYVWKKRYGGVGPSLSATTMRWPRAALKMMRWRFLFMGSTC